MKGLVVQSTLINMYNHSLHSASMWMVDITIQAEADGLIMS